METEHQHQHQQEGGGAAATKAQKGMRESMQKKLSGARFRHLNEQLYTSSSTDAFTYVDRPSCMPALAIYISVW